LAKTLTSTQRLKTPRHPVIPHELILQIREVVEPTISFEIVAHVLEVQGSDIQKIFVMHKHFDKKLASLEEKMNGRIRKTQMKEIRQEYERMNAKKNYQFKKIRGRLKIEVIHAKPVLGYIKFLRVSPIVN
jgi:hypothetical protein